ncbi:MAG TPA: transporter substrate-binding protein, partial [Pseudomonadota bacterium]|nr:transporter substrate-binding protein [Pseudomonadota bacterium]
VLLSETDFSSIVKKIQASKADVVLNFVQGDSNLPLFRELRAAGVTPAKVPVISFGIGENEISQLDGVDLTGDYLAWSYFESVDRPQNKQFVEAFKKKFGDHRGISDPMEAAYAGVYLWARAVKAAGSDDVRAIRKALQGQSIEGPGATLRLDPGNNHAWKMFRMGKLVGGNHIEVVYGSDKLLSPDPFPGTRTRAEWEALLQFLHSQWKGNWVNTDRPNLLKRGK